MTLTELRYLVNLDKERHFGRAAERSFVSQPTLSVAVKKLEDELGVMLFERNRGEARPTPVGERIIAQARKVLAEAGRVEDMAREGRDELVGPLRFGAIYTVGPYLLPGLVPLMRERAPRMPLVIEENFTAKLLEQLRDNELDVAVIALPVDLHGLNAWSLYDEDFVVLLPQDHRWAAEKQIPAKRLAEEHLLLLGPGHCFRDQVISACPKCVMVVSGLGITVVPRTSVENRGEDKALLAWRPLAAPAPTRRLALVWRKTFPRREAIKLLREAIFATGLKGAIFLPKEKAQESED